MSADRTKMKNLEVGMFGSAGFSNVQQEVSKSHYRTITVLVSDAATAGTAVTETPIGTLPNDAKVVAAYFKTPIAVTANDTTFATFTVSRRTAGGSGTAIGSQTTKITGGTGNVTAFNPNPLTLTAANVQCSAGDELTLAIAKASTGVALNAATSYVSVTVVLEEN